MNLHRHTSLTSNQPSSCSGWYLDDPVNNVYIWTSWDSENISQKGHMMNY